MPNLADNSRGAGERAAITGDTTPGTAAVLGPENLINNLKIRTTHVNGDPLGYLPGDSTAPI